MSSSLLDHAREWWNDDEPELVLPYACSVCFSEFESAAAADRVRCERCRSADVHKGDR